MLLLKHFTKNEYELPMCLSGGDYGIWGMVHRPVDPIHQHTDYSSLFDRQTTAKTPPTPSHTPPPPYPHSHPFCFRPADKGSNWQLKGVHTTSRCAKRGARVSRACAATARPRGDRAQSDRVWGGGGGEEGEGRGRVHQTSASSPPSV